MEVPDSSGSEQMAVVQLASRQGILHPAATTTKDQ